MTVGDHPDDLGFGYHLNRRMPKAERIVVDLADAEDEAMEHRRKGRVG